ncbi:MAG: hypothetical protein NZZ41_01350 [Candidatus Dojkabacteria bacterium]|nr:hypothetical protein [Candidatus Dojkabacteria bacterium]
MNSKKKLLRPYNATMVLLDHRGEPQMYLEGGELVISRVETEKVIELAKKAKTDEDFIKLGKLMYEIRSKQKKRKPQFVKN